MRNIVLSGIGVLGQLDLVSFVAHHSHIVAMQIDEATSVDELQSAAQRIDAMVQLLQDGGIKIERIANHTAGLTGCAIGCQIDRDS